MVKRNKPEKKRVTTRTSRINNVNRQSSDAPKQGGRDKRQIRYLKMVSGKAQRTKAGKIHYQELASTKAESKPARVQPDRRWFGNTRLVGQKQLERFREEMSAKVNNPYEVVLKHKKLPMSLLSDAAKTKRMNLTSVESFEETFSAKRRRKKPKLQHTSLEALVQGAASTQKEYSEDTDSNILLEAADTETQEPIMLKGQSRRINEEMYKVVDSSDIIIQVLDARDPIGTRSKYVEKVLRTDRKHKHMIYVLNKCDLIPTWATARWIKHLSASYPTIAFHSSITNSFGKGALINLLRQFKNLHPEKKTLSVGLIGYPNVGKSSLVNTLRKKKVCNVAPIPGETKVWQYVKLFGNLHIIDCPGVVHDTNNSDTDAVLKSVVRVEKILDPYQYIVPLLDRSDPDHLRKTYGIPGWSNAEEFLAQVARKSGRILKGGEPDFNTVAKMVLHDWQRGKIPWFVRPPFEDDIAADEDRKEWAEAAELKKIEEENKDKFQPVQLLTKLNQTHEFGPNDLRNPNPQPPAPTSSSSSSSSSSSTACSNDNMAIAASDSSASSPEEEVITPEIQAKIDAIKVPNPMRLAEDDPLMKQARLLEYRRRQANAGQASAKWRDVSKRPNYSVTKRSGITKKRSNKRHQITQNKRKPAKFK